MSEYLPKLYENYGKNVRIALDMSNCVTKADLKGAAGVDKYNLAAKSDLASLKAEVDRIDRDKLKIVPADFSTKTVYDKLAANINTIDTSVFVLKTQYNTDKSGLEKKVDDANKKITDTCRLLEKTDYYAKITDIKDKIPTISDKILWEF